MSSGLLPAAIPGAGSDPVQLRNDVAGGARGRTDQSQRGGKEGTGAWSGRRARDIGAKTGSRPFIHSITRDCLDYVLLFSERHLCYLRESCQRYYSEARTHLGV